MVDCGVETVVNAVVLEWRRKVGGWIAAALVEDAHARTPSSCT